MAKKEQERLRIGNAITTLRKTRGMTQQEVADRTSIMRPHIARVEHGKYNFGFDTLQAIADVLNADICLVPRD